MKKMRPKHRKVFTPKAPAGICRICGCTEAHACEDQAKGEGCHWVDKARTMCSACDPAYLFLTGQFARKPDELPAFGLWCLSGGPDDRGYWMTDTTTQDEGHPAVFFERHLAESAAREENENGLGQMGWKVIVVELIAVLAEDRR